MLSNTFICCLVLVIIQLLQIQAKSLEELKEQYIEVIHACAKENNIEVEDFKKLKHGPLTTENEKCFFACSYKKTGMMDENGMMAVDNIKKIGSEIFQDDEERMKKLDMYINQCLPVNDAPVSDGAKGCERAALMNQCNEKAHKDGMLNMF